MEDNTKYPSYYVIDKDKGIELQQILAKVLDHLSGTEAFNHGNIGKYWVRYGKKDPSTQGKIETLKKIITFAQIGIDELEEELKKEHNEMVMPSEWVEDPLHDED